MKKLEIPVGKKVRGWGLRNEFGEFYFYPSQIGVNAGRIRLVKQSDGPSNCRYSIKETNSKIIVQLSYEKHENVFRNVDTFMKAVDLIIKDLMSYEF